MTLWVSEKIRDLSHGLRVYEYECLACPLKITLKGRPKPMMDAWAFQVKKFMEEHDSEEHAYRMVD